MLPREESWESKNGMPSNVKNANQQTTTAQFANGMCLTVTVTGCIFTKNTSTTLKNELNIMLAVLPFVTNVICTFTRGLLQLQSLEGDLSFDKMQSILARGNQILERFGLQAIEPPESFEEDDWKLEFEGNFYRRLTEADLRNSIDPSRIKDGDIIQVSEND